MAQSIPCSSHPRPLATPRRCARHVHAPCSRPSRRCSILSTPHKRASTAAAAGSAAGAPLTRPPRLPRLPRLTTSLSSYSSLIQSCIDSGAFHDGVAIHAQMLAEGFRPDVYLQTKLLMLYARSGEPSVLAIARELFDEMTDRNSTAWNTIILAYAREEDHVEVLKLFLRMQMTGAPPDRFTFPSVVEACVGLGLVDVLLQVHGLVLKSGLSRDVVVGSVLVKGYAAFRWMEDMLRAFDEINGANVVTWNAVIGGYVSWSLWDEAWGVFLCMENVNVQPNHSTFASALRTCGGLRSLDRGKQVHAKLVRHGFGNDTFVCNCLIDMYAKCGDDGNCLKVFSLMTQTNQVSWNSIISGLAHLGHPEESFLLFCRMQEFGYRTDRFNLASLLKACACLADVLTGRQLHGYLIRRWLDSDVILGSALVDMYTKSECTEVAHMIFSRLEERNEMSWNALLSGYVQEGNPDRALEVYHTMKSTNVLPDQFTFTSLLVLSSDQKNLDMGKQVHAHIIRTHSKPNLILETELVHMYAKSRRLDDAWKIFSKMPQKNAYSWNSMIDGLMQNGQAHEALEFFCQMQLAGIAPDCFSLLSSLSACIGLSDMEKCKEIHGYVVRNSLEEHKVVSFMIIDAYAKCGSLGYAWKVYNKMGEKDVNFHNIMISALIDSKEIDDAREIFEHMEERNISSWNNILIGYVKNNLGNEAFAFLQRMLNAGIEYDQMTMVLMFNLCASIPAIDKGKQLHACIIKKGFPYKSVVMDSAVVNMYAKGGYIKEARRYFDLMEGRNVIAWNGMISGYAHHGHSKEVLTLFENMQKEKIYPNDITFLSVLSSCAHTGLMEEGFAIFTSMIKEHAIKAKAEHYTCMVDLLGRAGYLDRAKEVIDRMPVEPEVSTWGALLGACRIHKNVDMASLAARKLFELDPKSAAHYILMSNIYASAGRLEEAEEAKKIPKERGMIKEPGISWIEIDNEIQIFHSNDRSHAQADDICSALICLYQEEGIEFCRHESHTLQMDNIEKRINLTDPPHALCIRHPTV